MGGTAVGLIGGFRILAVSPIKAALRGCLIGLQSDDALRRHSRHKWLETIAQNILYK